MEIKQGQRYEVTVTKILDYGAVVTLEDNSTQLIHISKLSDDFISNVAEFVSIGQKCEAVGVKGKVHPVELSMRKRDLTPKEDRVKVKQHVPKYPNKKFSDGVDMYKSNKPTSNRRNNKQYRNSKEWD